MIDSINIFALVLRFVALVLLASVIIAQRKELNNDNQILRFLQPVRIFLMVLWVSLAIADILPVYFFMAKVFNFTRPDWLSGMMTIINAFMYLIIGVVAHKLSKFKLRKPKGE